MKLEVTKEKVIEASKACPEVKKVLEKLFPEVFTEDKYFDLSKLPTVNEGDIFTDSVAMGAGFDGGNFLQIRNHGEFAGKSFYLSEAYNWELILDAQGLLCLIPTKKL